MRTFTHVCINFRILILLFIILLLFSSAIYAERKSFKYPNSKYDIYLDNKNIPGYRRNAQKIGFMLGKKYTYTEYAAIKRENNVGISGEYEFLLFSTGGNGMDDHSYEQFNKQKCGWETTYYKNHNLTVIHEVCKENEFSFVRILKVGTGKNKNLHLD